MATVNTKNEWKEDFIDSLVDLIFRDDPNFNPAEYKKILDPTTGQIVSNSATMVDDGNLVLYQEDYQQ